MIHGVSVAEAFGTSSRYAKVRASENALKEIESLTPEQYRHRYSCDCHISDQEDDISMQMGTAI